MILGSTTKFNSHQYFRYINYEIHKTSPAGRVWQIADIYLADLLEEVLGAGHYLVMWPDDLNAPLIWVGHWLHEDLDLGSSALNGIKIVLNNHPQPLYEIVLIWAPLSLCRPFQWWFPWMAEGWGSVPPYLDCHPNHCPGEREDEINLLFLEH